MNNKFQPMSFNGMMDQVNQGGDTFKVIRDQIKYRLDVQTFRKMYWYVVDGSLDGQDSNPYFITTEANMTYDCRFALGYAFSYDSVNATDFPIPNSAGLPDWAGDGLSVSISTGQQGTSFQNGDIPFKLLFAPGYGLSFQNALPFEYMFSGNSKIKMQITNRDNVDRTHTFAIVLGGFLVSTEG